MAQSINDYLKSYGVDPNERYSNSSKKTTTTSKKTTSSSSGGSSKKNSSSSSKYYTTVTESNGTKSDGYIQDGVSYYSNGTPINAGASVVDSTGKTWTKGGDPDAGLSIDAYLGKYGVSGSSSNSYKPNYGDLSTEEVAYNPYEEAYRESQKRYEELEAQIKEQNRLAVEQGTNRLNSQKSNINQSADENARQAYIQYMQSQKALPQQLASQGVSGGATETANLGLQTAYQNNVNAINQNKANRLQEIDNAIVDLQNTGDLSTVEQVLANNQAALDAYMNNFDKGVSYNQWAQQFNANREDTLAEQAYRDKVYADQLAQQNRENQWYEQSYKDQMAQQDRENQWYEQSYADKLAQYQDTKTREEIDRVIALLGNGLYNRETASALLGVPVEQLDKFVADINKARDLELRNTQSLISNRNSGGSGGNSGGTKTNQTYSQVLKAIQDLNTTSGADYSENLASARYLLNSDLSGADQIRIMKQTNVRPEAYVRQMVAEGYTEEEIGAFVDSYTPKQDYRDALIEYAYQR